MPPIPMAVLEIDDNTPSEQAPWTNDVSMWSFQHDLNLHTRTAAETFRTIHETIGGAKFRGYPVRVARATKELLDQFVDAEEITWLSGTELATIASLLPKGDHEVERTLRVLFETIEVVGSVFGRERVRLVFAFV